MLHLCRVILGAKVLAALENGNCTVYLATQTAHGQSVDVVIPKGEVGAARLAMDNHLKDLMAAGELDPIQVTLILYSHLAVELSV